MHIFFSADVGGVAATALWSGTELKEPCAACHARGMTQKVKAACEGALAAGPAASLLMP